MAHRAPSRSRPQVVGLDHVQLAMSPGGESRAREFYGRLLGLAEVEKPAQLADHGGCWFVSPAVHVHLGVEALCAARKAHPALVADLAGLADRLAAAGVEIVTDDVDIGVSRCYVADPFGNRIELVAASDAGFTERQPPISDVA